MTQIVFVRVYLYFPAKFKVGYNKDAIIGEQVKFFKKIESCETIAQPKPKTRQNELIVVCCIWNCLRLCTHYKIKHVYVAVYTV